MANSIENSDHNPLMVSLDHVQICVPEAGLAEARAFYGGVLGLAEIPKPEILRERGGAWYRCGDRQIHLGALPDSPTTYRAPEKAHFAVQVTDLDAIRQRLAAAGAPIDVDVQIPGFQRFYARDPFGNRLEFLKPAGCGRYRDIARRRLSRHRQPDQGSRASEFWSGRSCLCRQSRPRCRPRSGRAGRASRTNRNRSRT